VNDTSPPTSDPAPDSSTWLLWVAAASVGLSALVLYGGLALHFAGYALASLLAFTLIAMFRRRTVERSASLGIGVPQRINLLAVAILLLGFVVSIAHSWFIASHFS
jgi:hypothetical protein